MAADILLHCLHKHKHILKCLMSQVQYMPHRILPVPRTSATRDSTPCEDTQILLWSAWGTHTTETLQMLQNIISKQVFSYSSGNNCFWTQANCWAGNHGIGDFIHWLCCIRAVSVELRFYSKVCVPLYDSDQMFGSNIFSIKINFTYICKEIF